jgi:Tol biopolymer transport system component
MRSKNVLIVLGVLCVPGVGACAPGDQFPVLSGPYLGLEPPGDTPVVFAPGIVSTPKQELNSIFTPDGKSLYFSISGEGDEMTVMEMRLLDGRWTAPAVASFSSSFGDVDPFVSPDGNRIFFGSKRPRPGDSTPAPNWQIWVADRVGDDWGEPRWMPEAVNSGSRQIYPSVAADGTLYFQSNREGTLGGSDIFVSRMVDGVYTDAENAGPPISSEYDEGDVFVAPDGSYLIFVSRDRPGGFGSGDLYISYLQEDATWSEAINLGETINTDEFDYCPVVSPDGLYFFYSSAGQVYWVDAGFLEILRNAGSEP